MAVYVTSDLHFHHKNILTFNSNTRPYQSVEHMNASMISEWNNTVTDEDTVYILGDVGLCSQRKAIDVMEALSGNKILIEGNHDNYFVQNRHFARCFTEIHQYLEIKHNKHKICMFHFPILEWNGCHHGSVQLHGHLHGAPSGLERYRVRDVGMDATGKVVSLLDDILADALTGEIKNHGGINE